MRAIAVCTPADIAFILDSSGSIGEANWVLIKNYLVSVVQGLDINGGRHKVAFVTYGNEAQTISNFAQSNSQAEVQGYINGMTWLDQNTNTTGALRHTRERLFQDPTSGDRSFAPNIAVVITDGATTVEVAGLRTEADLNKALMEVYAIGITDFITRSELETMASTGDYIKRLNSFADLTQTPNINTLNTALCQTGATGALRALIV